MDFTCILKKIRGEQLSPQEQEQFERWYGESETHRDFFHKVQRNLLAEAEQPDVDQAWLALEQKLNTRSKSSQKWYYVAAAVVVIAFLTVTTFIDQSTPTPVADLGVVIPAGTDKATLTLSDGSLVLLQEDYSFQNDHLATQGDELVYRPSLADVEVRYNELTVPRGGQYKVKLADGTQVWLNSESKLRYPVAFKEDRLRTVELVYGEAFFAVSPSAENGGNNFQVKTTDQVIEVMGTQFNVENYQGEQNIETTLVEGSIQLKNLVNQQELLLEPGHQVVYSKRKAQWQTKTVDTERVMAWKEGYFKFKDKPLQEIMQTISRWYDVEVRFQDGALAQVRFNGVFKKDQALQSILNILKESGTLDYHMEERELVISRPHS